jgi:uncharacterized membrane protein
VEIYPWVVIAHVVAVIVAFGAHGVSAFAMFRVRRERNRVRLAAILDLSASALGIATIGLLIALILGVVATLMGGFAGQGWPWISVGILVIVGIAMTPMAVGPMGEVRRALGMPTRRYKAGDRPRMPAPDPELTAAQARLRPELVTSFGVVAIVVLVWLMEAKPV